MNRFLNELVKAALGVITLVGIGLLATGIVFLICPDALRWSIVLISIFVGASLCGWALYWIIKAKTP